MSDDFTFQALHPFNIGKSIDIKQDNFYNTISTQKGILVSIYSQGLNIYNTNYYENQSISSDLRRDKIIKLPNALTINLSQDIKYVKLNNDASKLLVIVTRNSQDIFQIYDVNDLFKNVVKVVYENNGMEGFIKDVKWHPVNSSDLLICFQSGLIFYKFNPSIQMVKNLPNALTCDWSPKGKQFAALVYINKSDHFQLKQYDLSFNEKRSTDILNIKDSLKTSFDLLPTDLSWISSYNFVLSFRPNCTTSNKYRIITGIFSQKRNTLSIVPGIVSSSDCIETDNALPMSRLYSMLIADWNLVLLVNNTAEYIGAYLLDAESNLVLLENYALPVGEIIIGVCCDLTSNSQVPAKWLGGKSHNGSCPLLILSMSNGNHYGIFLVYNNKKLETVIQKLTAPSSSQPQSTPQITQESPSKPTQIFGNIASQPPVNDTKSLFGIGKTSTPLTGGLFGANTNSNSTNVGSFGSRPTNSEIKTSLFSIPSSTNTTSVFGQPSSSLLFGAANAPNASSVTPCKPEEASKSIFGNPSSSLTNQPSTGALFGSSNAAQSSIKAQSLFSNKVSDESNDENARAENKPPVCSNIAVNTQPQSNTTKPITQLSTQTNTLTSQNPLSNISNKSTEFSSKLTGNLQTDKCESYPAVSKSDSVQTVSKSPEDPSDNVVLDEATKAMTSEIIADTMEVLEKKIDEIKLKVTNSVQCVQQFVNGDTMKTEVPNMLYKVDELNNGFDKLDKCTQSLSETCATVSNDIKLGIEFSHKCSVSLKEIKNRNKKIKSHPNFMLQRATKNLNDKYINVKDKLEDLESSLEYFEQANNSKRKQPEDMTVPKIFDILRSHAKLVDLENSKVELLKSYLGGNRSQYTKFSIKHSPNNQLRLTELTSVNQSRDSDKELIKIMSKWKVIDTVFKEPKRPNVSTTTKSNIQAITLPRHKHVVSQQKPLSASKPESVIVTTKKEPISIKSQLSPAISVSHDDTPKIEIKSPVTIKVSAQLTDKLSFMKSAPIEQHASGDNSNKSSALIKQAASKPPTNSFGDNAPGPVQNKPQNSTLAQKSSFIPSQDQSTSIVKSEPNTSIKQESTVFTTNSFLKTEQASAPTLQNQQFPAFQPKTTSSLLGTISSTQVTSQSKTTSHLAFTTTSPQTQLDSPTQSIPGPSSNSLFTTGQTKQSTPSSGAPWVSTTSQNQTSLFGTSDNKTSPDTATRPLSLFESPQATTQKSIFNSSSQQSTLFGTPDTKTTQNLSSQAQETTKPLSLFDTTQNTPNKSIFNTSSTTQSIFGSASAATTASSTSLFGSNNPTQSTAAPGSSLFASPNSTSNQSNGLFNTSNKPVVGLFENTGNTNSSSLFGDPQKPSGSQNQTQSSGSLFGNTAQNNLFASSNQPSSSSIFGTNQQSSQYPTGTLFSSNASASATTTASTTASTSTIFGKATQQKTGGIFGSSQPQTTQGSIFGGGQVQTTTQGSIFGGGQAQTTQGSIFGGGQAQTTQGSIFGGGQAQTTQSSIFGGGQVQTSTQGSIFGSNQPQTASTQGSIFGGSQPTKDAPSSSIFGNSNSFMSGLGGKPSSSSSNVFQTPSPFGNNTSGSGGQTNSLFAPSSNSPARVTTPGQSSTLFSSPTQPANPVQGSSLFGASPSFGTANNTAGSSMFGGSALFGSSTVTNASNAATSNTNTTGLFGSGMSQQQPTFGSISSSAQNTQQSSSLFGSQGVAFTQRRM